MVDNRWWLGLDRFFWAAGGKVQPASAHRTATHQDRNCKAARDGRKRRRQEARATRKATRYGL
jgi:hypothetical protein